MGFSLAFRNFAAEAEAGRRVHPWTRAEGDANWVYVDFKASHQAVRASLEDLRPYADRHFAQEFFGLIEWMNSDGRLFETNDFAFRRPRSHPDRHNPWPLRCDGRLMFLFRELVRNCYRDEMETAAALIVQTLNQQEGPKSATVGLSLHPTTYSQLSPDPKLGADGLQFQFSFFAYGNNPSQCFGEMARLVTAMRRGLPGVEGALAVPQGEAP